MISIITITYNRKDFLKEALDSVLAQTYTDFEHILVDDGSTDGTEDLVKTYNDPRLKYFYFEHTGQISVHKNTGLEKTRGSIIAFLDSDDYWHRDYLREIAAVYASSQINSVITNAVVFGQGYSKSLMQAQNLPLLEGNLLEQKLSNDHFIACSCCFSFRSLPGMKFNEDLQCGGNDFYIRVLSLGNSVILLKELAYIRKHHGNISRLETYDSSFIQAFNEEFVTLDYLKKKKLIGGFLYRQVYSRFLYRQAANLKKIGMLPEAAAGYKRAFRIFPFRVKAFIKSLLL